MNRFKKRTALISTVVMMLVGFTSTAALAADSEATLSTATVLIFVCGVLVMFMQAGFALLESGSSRAKNSVNVIIKNFGDLAIGSIVFTLVGYGFMFGDNPTGLFGQSKFMMNGLDEGESLLVFFQLMFAATSATITSGAMAERTSIVGYLLAAAVIMTFIYPVFGSWVWGGGWLSEMQFHDFAGSTVVHSVGGWCALAGVIVVGPRIGRFGKDGTMREIPGHNATSTALGCFILWFGWFGFNVGSSLGDPSANYGNLALVTHLGAVAGIIGSILSSLLFFRFPIRVLGIVNGALAGLVSITGGVDLFDPVFAIIAGFIGGVVYIVAERLLHSLKVDDVVSAVAVHGFAGAWGTIAIGFHSPYLFGAQIIGVIAAFLFTFPTAMLLYYVISKTVGLRVPTMHEQRGLDYSEHGEIAYPEFQETLHE